MINFTLVGEPFLHFTTVPEGTKGHGTLVTEGTDDQGTELVLIFPAAVHVDECVLETQQKHRRDQLQL